MSGTGHTVYLRQLNDKLSRERLVKNLWTTFSQYGEILDITARPKCQKLRGQAWVVYRNPQSAMNAVAMMNGKLLDTKIIHAQLSSNKSDQIAKLDGTFVERRKPKTRKKKRQEKLDAIRRRRDQIAEQWQARKKANRTQVPHQPTATDQAATTMPMSMTAGPMNRPGAPNPGQMSVPGMPPQPMNMGQDPNASNVLLVQNIPDNQAEATQMLTLLFQAFAGFKDVKPAGRGSAMVEFNTIPAATAAKKSLHDVKLTPQHLLQVSFVAKR